MASLPARTAAAGLPAVWLRDNCRCAECLDPVTGQRLRTVTDLPAGLTISDVSVAGGQVTVRFQPDGHRAVFDQAWLARHAAGPGTAGDCVIFDNTRILHGRTGFTGQGGRHLQGCYADLDGVESAVAVAGRAQHGGKDRT